MLFTKTHRLGQLHDELVAAFPDLKDVLRVEGGVGGVPEAIRLSLPDGVPDPGLSAVVAAHTPVAPTPDPIPLRLRAWARDPSNPPVTRAVVLDLLRFVARRLVD